MRKLIVFAFVCAALEAQPVLDGKIDDAEWAKATTHSMANGGTLRVLPGGDAWYFAVQIPEDGYGHFYVADGDSIQVIHVSAALGRLQYRRNGTEWSTSDQFVWQMRDRTYSDTLRAAQEKYFAENGWVGTNNGMGRGRFELKLRRTPGKPVRVAMVFMSGPQKQCYWPESLDDDTRNTKLIAGQPIAAPRFDTAQWFELK